MIATYPLLEIDDTQHWDICSHCHFTEFCPPEEFPVVRGWLLREYAAPDGVKEICEFCSRKCITNYELNHPNLRDATSGFVKLLCRAYTWERYNSSRENGD